MPGSSQFCAKIEDLPAPGELNDFSDVVLGVGTDNLKLADADPLVTAQKLYHKILSYRREIPNTRLILPGVLPSGDSAVNERVKIYNKHLADICNSRTNNMIKFVDTRVFGDRKGKLRSKFRCENDGDLSLHVNHEGIKLLAIGSRRPSERVTTFQQVHVLEHGTESRPLQLTGVVELVVVEGITEVEEPLEVVPPQSPLDRCFFNFLNTVDYYFPIAFLFIIWLY